MKKLVIAIGIALAISMAMSCSQNTKPKALSDPLTQTRITLNGISYIEADALVKNFLKNKGIYSKETPTSIWFSQAIFHGMDSLMQQQSADGLRIYFAKNPDSTNAVVVVSTFDGGVSSDNQYVNVHRDFFQAKGDEVYSSIAGVRGVLNNDGGGATLYTDPKCLPPGRDGCDPKKFHYITCQRAYNMVHRYGTDPINATSEWYDAGIIHDLDSVLTVQKGDGIRIYFARHIDPDMTEPSDTVHRHGFVLITTQLVGNIHKDYYDCFLIHPLYIDKKHNPLFGGTDNGEQCPTNCSGTTWP